MNRSPSRALAALAAAAVGESIFPVRSGSQKRGRPDSDGFVGKGRIRTHTPQDTAAFNKRVSKRRAKKGYR